MEQLRPADSFPTRHERDAVGCKRAVDLLRSLDWRGQGENDEGGEGETEMIGGKGEGLAVHLSGGDGGIRGKGKRGKVVLVGGDEAGGEIDGVDVDRCLGTKRENSRVRE